MLLYVGTIVTDLWVCNGALFAVEELSRSTNAGDFFSICSLGRQHLGHFVICTKDFVCILCSINHVLSGHNDIYYYLFGFVDHHTELME